MSTHLEATRRLQDEPRVTLVWTGPSGQVVVDATTKDLIDLVAGGRYQMPASVAEYRLTKEAHLWTRPDSPKTSTAADQE
jgi:hypothetical protein